MVIRASLLARSLPLARMVLIFCISRSPFHCKPNMCMLNVFSVDQR